MCRKFPKTKFLYSSLHFERDLAHEIKAEKNVLANPGKQKMKPEADTTDDYTTVTLAHSTSPFRIFIWKLIDAKEENKIFVDSKTWKPL